MISLSKNLIGHNDLVKNILNNYEKKTLSNSIIFSGQKGIGKTTAAFYLINKLFFNIDSKNNNNHLTYKNLHPNIRYIQKLFDEKTNKFKSNISIDQIRGLGNFINQSAFENLPKFIIIDSVDDLNNSSSNSLLKSLEEPKINTYFILITHQISSILPTIKSRCINYIAENPSYAQFCEILNNNNAAIDISNINFLFNVTNGSPGLANSIYSEDINVNFNNIIEIFSNKENLELNIINLANNVGKYSNNRFRNFLILLRFIILSVIKINLGYVFDKNLSLDIIKFLNNISNLIPNKISLEILEFINENEKDMLIYNLDKKIFCFNIFSPLSRHYG